LPGTLVRLHGIQAAGAKYNGEEGTCKKWFSDKGRMHVLLNNGETKALKPDNLRKIESFKPKDADPAFDHVLEIFRRFDIDGNGSMDFWEIEGMMKSIGLSTAHIEAFLSSIDKDGDLQVRYEEFVAWALSETPSKEIRSEVYWPEAGEHEEADKLADDEEEVDEGKELSMEDLEKLCGRLPTAWPEHGIKVVNNMRERFPDYPVQGIVMMMSQNDYIGGKVIAAIRATGAKEIEVTPAGALRVGRPGAFPGEYRVRSTLSAQDPAKNQGRAPAIHVYKEGGRNWSWQNLRKHVLPEVGRLARGERFTIMEVRRGNDRGFCFGRIIFGDRDQRYWVNLGIEATSSSHWTRHDSSRGGEDLNFTDAERLED